MTDQRVDPEIDDDEEEEAPGLWTSFGIALRLIVGWFCVAIGVLNLIVEVDRVTGEPDMAYFVFHSMLFVGGIALLAVSWLGRSPGPVGYTAGGLVLVGGMVISGWPVTNTVCCMESFAIRHGWPFSFVARNEGTGEAGRWHIDSQHLLADLLFWGYVGLMALIVVSLARRAVGNGHQEEPAVTEEAPQRSTHAEPRPDEATPRVRENQSADD